MNGMSSNWKYWNNNRIDDAIINLRLNEHESENNPSNPSITRCINDLMSFINAYVNNNTDMFAVCEFLLSLGKKSAIHSYSH